ncbi:MAG TPA: serine hydrolase domain-containing protein [Planctomycetota bacterium]
MYKTAPVLVLLAACAAPAPDPGLRAKVDAAVAGTPRVDLVVGVIADGRPSVFGYGADGATVFEIGSITKAFTGALLATLAAEGKVAPDDPVQRHLPPDWTAPSRLGRPITLAQLATHTSGLPRLPDNLGPKDLRNPYADYSDARLREFLARVTLGTSPGERYAYSNLGAGLLGWILARVDGRSYEELVVDRICGPLGLKDTRIALSDGQKRRLAPGHSGGQAVWNWDIPVISGAGALRSTADDLLRFLAANLEGRFAASHQPRFRTSEGDTWVALGWHVSPLPGGRPMVWHNGGTGGYRSFAGFVKESRTAVVVLSNTAEDFVDPLGVAILELLQR